MSEHSRDRERQEWNSDPELLRCSERLGDLCETLGYTESDDAAQARQLLVRAAWQQAGNFDANYEQHRALLAAYQEAAEVSLQSKLHPEVAIGYQLMQAKLWFDLDDPVRFYDRLDVDGDEGVVRMLECTPGCEPHLRTLLAIVDAIEALNTRE